jgi:hypothetical protein
MPQRKIRLAMIRVWLLNTVLILGNRCERVSHKYAVVKVSNVPANPKSEKLPKVARIMPVHPVRIVVMTKTMKIDSKQLYSRILPEESVMPVYFNHSRRPAKHVRKKLSTKKMRWLNGATKSIGAIFLRDRSRYLTSDHFIESGRDTNEPVCE